MTARTDTGWIPDDESARRPPGKSEAPTTTKYKTLPAWVEEYLAPLIRRRLGGQLTWCAHWWKHPEAVSRLGALWDEWEKARLENTLSAWWLTHCDPHLAVLMSRDNGPFMACRADDKETRHVRLDPLTCAPSDPGLWRGKAFSDPDPM